jgi:hypothetical protein
MNSFKNSSKLKFTGEEDQTIIELVSQFGNQWSLMSKEMKTRSARQIRERYLNYLDPKRIHGNWTKEEDQKLLSLLSSESKISWKRVEKDFPGRTDVSIKNRSKGLLKLNQIPKNIDHPTAGKKNTQISSPKTEIEEMNYTSNNSTKEDFLDVDLFFLSENSSKKSIDFSFLELNNFCLE